MVVSDDLVDLEIPALDHLRSARHALVCAPCLQHMRTGTDVDRRRRVLEWLRYVRSKRASAPQMPGPKSIVSKTLRTSSL